MTGWLRCTLITALAVPAYCEALDIKGRLEWVHEVEMRVVESGIVDEIHVTTGQHVKADDLLLRMDQRGPKAQLLEARARVARAAIATASAERELVRAQELFARGLIADEELKQAELEQAAAIAEGESAKASEAVAAVTLEHTELRAPFDGIIVARNVWKGEVIYKTLQQAPPIVIAPDDRMLARALVTADVLRRYRTGQAARINIGGRLREGRIHSLGVKAVRIDLNGAVYELDVIFELRPGELLRPSESIILMLP